MATTSASASLSRISSAGTQSASETAEPVARRFVCVHCGQPAEDLFKRVGQEIRLRHCSRCLAVVDHYIELEILLVFIDMQLLREGVYRHILHNRFAETPRLLRREAWRFCWLCLMLDTHSRWLILWDGQSGDAATAGGNCSARASGIGASSSGIGGFGVLPSRMFPVANLSLPQWMTTREGGWAVMLACAVETFVYMVAVAFCACALSRIRRAHGLAWWPQFVHVLVSLSVSSFGKLFVLVAMVWGGNGARRRELNLVIAAMVVASNVLGVKTAIRDEHWFRAVVAVVVGLSLRVVAAWALAAIGFDGHVP